MFGDEERYCRRDEVPAARFLVLLAPCLLLGVFLSLGIAVVPGIHIAVKILLVPTMLAVSWLVGFHFALLRRTPDTSLDPPVGGIPLRVMKQLLDEEEVGIVTRKHWIESVGFSVGLAVVTVVALFITALVEVPQVPAIVFIIWLLVACAAGYKIVESRIVIFVVTDKRAILFTGVFTTRVSDMLFIDVTDNTRETPLIGRILSYGTMILETPGQIQGFDRIKFLPDIDRIYTWISGKRLVVKENSRNGV